jgi:hypothetical protein
MKCEICVPLGTNKTQPRECRYCTTKFISKNGNLYCHPSCEHAEKFKAERNSWEVVATDDRVRLNDSILNEKVYKLSFIAISISFVLVALLYVFN